MDTEILILDSEHGSIKDTRVVKADNLWNVVKDEAKKLIDLWEPSFSDFVIIKENYEISLSLPLTKEQFEKYSKFNIRRSREGYALVNIPVYIISYDNEWIEDDYLDKKVRIITYYVDEEYVEEIKSWAEQITKGMRREFRIELTEEDLEHLEE